jgi:hypothetical protein
MPPLTAQAPAVTRRAVLGQLSKDPTDERFPMLVYEGETFGDFSLTTRFKIVSGVAEQMAGIAFRWQDEQNFYVIRASALGRNVRFYKVVNGERSRPIGPEVEVARDQWHELKIHCKGTEIRCELNGREVLPPLNDSSFRHGRIAFWTKSDSLHAADSAGAADCGQPHGEEPAFACPADFCAGGRHQCRARDCQQGGIRNWPARRKV